MTSYEQFLSLPLEELSYAAPATMVYTPGGTRRRAVLAGLSATSDEYPEWSRRRANDSIGLLFRCGVRHVFGNALCAQQLDEVGRHRERVLAWTAEGLAGERALEDYARLGWRVRIFGAASLPALEEAAERLVAATPATWKHTLWWGVTPEPGAHWRVVFDAVHRSGARSQAEAIRALYGEDVPPATLWLGFGKPFFSADMFPLLIADAVQCYWDQRPGFVADEALLRRILFDLAHTRRTWAADKTERYGAVPAQRDLWDQRNVIGLGRRVGNFWYPRTEWD
jgi:hypothetical protein